MKIIKLHFSSSSNLAVPADWNKTGTNTLTTAGVVIANLTDSAGSPSGVGFEIVSPFSGRGGSLTWADTDAHGIPRNVWCEAATIRSSTVNGSCKFTGLPIGQSGVIKTAGHTNSATVDTDYVINGGTAVRYDATAKPPAAPIEIPFTADSNGDVLISTNLVSTTTRANFFILEYTESTGATITDIDDLASGQSFNITFSDAGYLATSLTVSDGTTQKVVALALVSGATYAGTMPQITAGQAALLSGSVTVVATNGVEPTLGAVASYSISIQHPDSVIQSAMTQIQFVSISADSLSVIYEFDPQSQPGDWGIYDAARFTLSNDCESTGSYEGLTDFYFIAAADRIARVFKLDSDASDNPPVMPDDTTITVFVGDTVLVTGGAISGTAPITYAIGGPDASLFSINSSTGDVDFLSPAVVGSGQITRTATNSVDSATQTINFVVSSVPSGDNGLTSLGITSTGITMRGLTSVGL